MSIMTREMLAGYLEDALGEAETASIEQALRGSEALRNQLRQMMQERDRGEHSVGAIWRRKRLSCPKRENLGSYLIDSNTPGNRIGNRLRIASDHRRTRRSLVSGSRA